MEKSTDNFLVIKDVYKAFGKLKVLNGISINIPRGQTLSIIGQSGVGKSVTLRLLVGLLQPDQGTCYYCDQKLSKMNEQELNSMRQKFSMLFQSGALFDSMTIGQNIAFPAKLRGITNTSELTQIIEEKLYQVGLGKSRFPDMPFKMPSMVSGGQRKRIALARALAEEPEIILYDEPTTGLDPIMSDAISDLIISTRDQISSHSGYDLTSIIVTHDMNVAFKTSDRIIMLNAGKIVGEGTPEYFMDIENRKDTTGLTENELMIRQFVKGEATGPIQAVKIKVYTGTSQ